MESIIIVYTKEEAKRPYNRFDNFIDASFWIGMEYREPEGSGNVKLVRVEMYSTGDREGLDSLKTFVNLLLDRGIDHEVKFFPEPPPSGDFADDSTDSGGPPPRGDEAPPPQSEEPHQTGQEEEMEELREKRGFSERQRARAREIAHRRRKEVDEV